MEDCDNCGLVIKYMVNGELHRENDLPSVIIYDRFGNIKRQEWHKNGYLDRGNDRPAVIIESYLYTDYYWYIDGILVRKNNLPTFVSVRNPFTQRRPPDVTMNVGEDVYIIEKWFAVNEEPVKEHICNPMYEGDILNFTSYGDNMMPLEKIWYDKNGKKHRNGGPAFYEYDGNGNLWRVIYYKNGKLADNGPGMIEYDNRGEIIKEVYLINGKICTKKEWMDWNDNK